MPNIQSLLYYLAAFNFCDYAVISMSEGTYVAHHVETHGQYLPTWKGVVHVTIAFIAYFRYTGIFLILDVNTALVKLQKTLCLPQEGTVEGLLDNLLTEDDDVNERSQLIQHVVDGDR